MTKEIGPCPDPGSLYRRTPDGITASSLTRAMQTIGSRMLASARMHQVEAEVFSTCPEDLQTFDERLVHAKDTKTPLIEVTTFPDFPNYGVIQQILGTQNKLIANIVHSEGLERYDSFFGNILPYKRLQVVVPGQNVIALNGQYGKVITSCLDSGEYCFYDDSPRSPMWGSMLEPAHKNSYGYESDYNTHPNPMDRALTNMVRSFMESDKAS